MSTKTLFAFDQTGYEGIKDEASLVRNSNLKTEVILKNHETGEVIAKKSNKLVLPGAGLILRSLFDVADPEVTPTYNEALGLDNSGAGEFPDADSDFATTATPNAPKTMLFCIGTDGCGTEPSQVFSVPYNSWINPAALIPFRYPLVTNDLPDEVQNLYGGRKEDGDYVAYYFKRFTSGPTLIQQYEDGTPIDGNVLNMAGMGVESLIEMKLSLTKYEAREFFVATTGIDECKFNSISLCHAYVKIVNGKPVYYNIRPTTRLNIPNEPLIDATKGVDIIYHVYA